MLARTPALIRCAQFDDPLDREPQIHVFRDSRVDWARPAADERLPRKGG